MMEFRVMFVYSKIAPATVILLCMFADSFGLAQDRALSGNEVLRILTKTKVASFEIKNQRPDLALEQLLLHVEKQVPGIAKHVRIQSKHRAEELRERLERYPNLHLKFAEQNAAQIFIAVVEVARWHFELKSDGIIIADWHRGDLPN